MRVAIDGTPAATQIAGVGRYTRELLKALVSFDSGDSFQIYCAADAVSVDRLELSLPTGAWRELRRFPISERAATAIWQRLHVPLPIDTFLNEFDVLHGPDFVLPPTRLASVVTIHDLSYLVAPELGEPALVSYLRNAVPRTLRRADQIITVSASVAADLVNAYPFARDRVRAIPNGVSVPVGPGRSQQAHGTPTILTVGTIEPRKNHLRLLEAMHIVWDTFPEAQLIIAGRVGWRSDRIVEQISHAVRSSNVTFVEAPGDSHLERLFEEASVFVYPSLYEGFGLPVLEAMARCVPVVSSDIPALRETGGDAASYASPLDPEHIGTALVRLLGDDSLRTRMIDSGLDRVSQHTWSETARRTRMAYGAALEGHQQ